MLSMIGLHAGQLKETIRTKKKAPYKEEPAKKIIEECEKVADKFKCDPPPVPPEVEL